MDGLTKPRLSDHVRQRAIDVLIVWVLFATGLGAFWLYRRVAAHDAIDQRLIGILSKQDETVLEQRCLASGFAKEAKEDAAKLPPER